VLALMLLKHTRLPARLDSEGRIVTWISGRVAASNNGTALLSTMSMAFRQVIRTAHHGGRSVFQPVLHQLLKSSSSSGSSCSTGDSGRGPEASQASTTKPSRIHGTLSVSTSTGTRMQLRGANS